MFVVKNCVTLITGSPFAAYAATSNDRMIAGVLASSMSGFIGSATML
jgi:hypothetical protein